MNKNEFVHAEIQKLHQTLHANDAPHMLVAVVDNETQLCDYALDLEHLGNYYAMFITIVESVAKNSNDAVRQALIDILHELINRVNKIKEADNE